MTISSTSLATTSSAVRDLADMSGPPATNTALAPAKPRKKSVTKTPVAVPGSLLDTHPALVAAEWDYEANTDDGLHPETLTAGSSKRVWRKPPCCKEPYLIQVKNLTGTGEKKCPSLIHSIAFTHKELVEAEWDYRRNDEAGLYPTEFTSGSKKKAWRIAPCCRDSHLIAVKVWMGPSETKCPSVKHTVAHTHAEKVAEEWDYPGNNTEGIRPDQVTAGMSKKVWRIAPCCGTSHLVKVKDWLDPTKGVACPTVHNSLAALYPTLVETEWDHVRNTAQGLDPEALTAGSDQKAWRIAPCCGDSHLVKIKTWVAPGEKKCPSVKHTVAHTHAEKVAAEWDYPGNNTEGIRPDQVTAGSSQKVWRIAPCCGTSHLVIVKHWVADKVACTVTHNSLLTTNPALVEAEWDVERNSAEGLDPAVLTPGTHHKVWRIAPCCGVSHRATVRDWFLGRSTCPVKHNNLTSTHPEVVTAEWAYGLNSALGLDPAELTAGMNRKAWRTPTCCSEPQEVVIKDWFAGRLTCPCQHQRWTPERTKRFIESLMAHGAQLTPAERWVIAEQSGVLESSKKREEAMRRVLAGAGNPADMVTLTGDSDVDVDGYTEGNVELAGCDDAATSLEAGMALDTDPVDVTVSDVLSGLATGARLVGFDKDARSLQFLLDSAVHKLWTATFANEATAVADAKAALLGDPTQYQREALDRFLSEYTHARSLSLPDGWVFAKGDPNLMQWHVAAQVIRQRRVGNWSQAGTGKTLSAVLASRLIDSNLTVVVCPNAVAGRDEASGWVSAVHQMLGVDGVEVHVGDLTPTWTTNGLPRFLIVHQDVFARDDTPDAIDALLAGETVNMVVTDEVHFLKRRGDATASNRRTNVLKFLSGASEANPDLAVLGLTATPVVNELSEAVSVLSLVTGDPETDLVELTGVKGLRKASVASVSACMAVHQRLMQVGTRLRQHDAFPTRLTRVSVDASDSLDALIAAGVGKGAHPATIERILTEARLPAIVDACKQGPTLLYTEYIDGIGDMLADALRDAGLKVAFQTGERKEINQFLTGGADVLIGTSSVGTGVDGLQDVAHRLVVNALPWTAAAWEQLVARLARTGQTNTVEVVLPETYIDTDNGRWSWCEGRWARIVNKQTVADAAVDGHIPAADALETPAQVTHALLKWLDRLTVGEVEVAA